MIIIPDVHGREYWKLAVDQRKDDEEVIFLGDYLDPYPTEIDPLTNSRISKLKAIDNFKEILKYADEHDKTYLLLGNHDTEYVYDTIECRCDDEHFQQIKELFNNNIDKFYLTFSRTFNGKQYLFSHSCVLKKWLDYIQIEYDGVNAKELCFAINSLDASKRHNALDIASYIRGGYKDFGSCVWADVREINEEDYELNNTKKTDIYQIFGHTQLRKNPIIMDYWAMLDCRQAFRLDDDTNEITQITHTEGE